MRYAAMLLALTFLFLRPGAARPADYDIEWTEKKRLTLDVTPLDISASPDGEWLYLLAPGEVLLYSLTDEKVVRRIPVEEAFDRIAYSSRRNVLVLTSSDNRTMRFIRLEKVYDIATSGLPFKGPEDAPVVVAAFTDFQ